MAQARVNKIASSPLIPDTGYLIPDSLIADTGYLIPDILIQDHGDKSPEHDKDLFNQFWKNYPGPRKKDKPKAAELFKRQPIEIQETIVSHILHRQQVDPEWLKDNGKFIPGPVPFLNQHGWTDEYRIQIAGSDEKTQRTMAAMQQLVDEYEH